jgi:hypothetical protein
MTLFFNPTCAFYPGDTLLGAPSRYGREQGTPNRVSPGRAK